jgi:hypothetical protein
MIVNVDDFHVFGIVSVDFDCLLGVAARVMSVLLILLLVPVANGRLRLQAKFLSAFDDGSKVLWVKFRLLFAKWVGPSRFIQDQRRMLQ